MKTQQPFEVLVNEKKHDVLLEEAHNLDIVENGDGTFHVLMQNKKFDIEIVNYDKFTKTFDLLINNNVYKTSISDKYDQLIQKLGLNKVATAKVNEIKAQMPGMVLEVNVKVGDSIVKGDKILILEAMKMENVIKSPGDGTVKKVNIQKGSAVEKGQILIELD
jgi:biotin carboxyl carrier protein